VTHHAQIEFHGGAKLAGPFLRSESERLGDATERQLAGVLNGR
jgi:hypothetical protein